MIFTKAASSVGVIHLVATNCVSPILQTEVLLCMFQWIPWLFHYFPIGSIKGHCEKKTLVKLESPIV